jgi:nucleoside 2-deoxyribosyltransferase
MTGVRVYLAAALSCAPAMRDLAVRLRAAGHTVVSTWHDVTASGAIDPSDDESRAVIVVTNAMQVSDADVVVADSRHGQPCAMYTEIGYALGEGTPVVWIQPPAARSDGVRHTNIFDAFPTVLVAHSDDEALEWLEPNIICGFRLTARCAEGAPP